MNKWPSASKMSSATLYLEHYLDSLDSLPGELRRNFTLLLELDSKNKSLLESVDAASDDFLKEVRDMSPGKRKEEMEKIQVRGKIIIFIKQT